MFAVVDDISPGYEIWNVSIDMPDGYLPLCRLKMFQPFEGGQEVDTKALQAIKIADATKLRGQYTDAIVAIGNPVIRKQWIEQLLEIGYELPLIRHPHSIVMPSAKVEKGCIIEAQAVINSNAKVGTSCFICAGAVVNHNAIVEDYCQIDCNAVITAASRVSKELRIPCGQVY